MRTGKISGTVLKRSILKNIKYKSPALICGPAQGVRCTRRLPEPDEHSLFAQVSVSGCVDVVARMAFFRLANDLSASGGRLAGVLAALFLPSEMRERQLKQIMGEICGLAQEAGTDILGGHTEVRTELKEPLLVLTGLGYVWRDTDAGACYFRPGQDIVMTKWAGAAGAACLVKSERAKTKLSGEGPLAGFSEDSPLFSRFPNDFLDRAAQYFQRISSVADAKEALGMGTKALYNAGKTGLFGALWEIGEASGVGLCVEHKKIPVRQETIEICEFFDRNPYLIPSDGVLLAGTDQGEALVKAFEAAGIPAAIIGTVTGGRDRVVENRGVKRFLVPPGTDA